MQSEIIKEQEICTWQDFVQKKENIENSRSTLYRGQPTPPIQTKQEKWEPYDLKTTYQRRFKSPDISNFYYKLEDFQRHKNNYSTLKNVCNVGNRSNLIPFILYLRHAGVPMPVLDVTYNPLTALYFSVYNLYDQFGVSNSFDSINTLNKDGYVSIFEFDIEVLEEYYDVKELHAIYTFQDFINDKVFFIRKFDNLPFDNKNMKLQEGAFIFIASSIQINQLLKNQLMRSNISLPAPIIHHRISYNSIFDDNSKENIYSYLEKRGKIGFNLFSDDQALLFDFLNPSFNI